jgi:hypothetical protein
MMRSEKEKQQSVAGLADSRRQLSASSKDVRQAFDLGRWGGYVTKSLREHLYAWMSLAAMVGWVLSRIPKKKQKVYALPSAKGLQGRGRKTAWPGQENPGKGGQKLLPLARELLTAVGLTLLKGKVKSWGFKLLAKRKRSAPGGPPLRTGQKCGE